LTSTWEKPVISVPQPLSRRTPQILRECPLFLPVKTGYLVGEKYRLEERLGEGAIGVVYRALHVGLEKSFAIKLLKGAGVPAPDALERFRREAVALGRLRHPNIVAVTDFGIDGPAGGLPYIVTELLEGWSLSDIYRDQCPLPLTDAFFLLGQIAAAVDSAHDAGVLHRDLKPGNVFVCSDNLDSPSVKVLDFGLAKLYAGPEKPDSDTLPGGAESPPGLTTTGLLLGTPQYLPPEVIRLGQASRSSDVYSFGVLAYEILGGKPPFRGTLEEVLACHLEADPPPLSLPPEIWRPLRETLRKDPALRPGTAGEVVRRFQEGMLEAERKCWESIEIPRPPRVARLRGARRVREVLGRLLGEFIHRGHHDDGRLYAFGGSQHPLMRIYGELRRLAAETRAVLAPGTALLSYYVGVSQSFLFVIEAAPGEGYFLYPLAIGRDEIEREVEAFCNVWGGPSTDLLALKERGRHLYDLLVRPAESVLGKADRWLIAPDGPLWTLPLGTLFSGTCYLADLKPIYMVDRWG
jgi:serine/threonine protein kinase